jgi:hypothetical protein
VVHMGVQDEGDKDIAVQQPGHGESRSKA